MKHVTLFVLGIVALIIGVVHGNFQTESEIGCFVPLACTEATVIGYSFQDSPNDCLDFCQKLQD